MLTETILKVLYDRGMSIVEVMSSMTWHQANMRIGRENLDPHYFDNRCDKCFMEKGDSLCSNGHNTYLFDLTKGRMDSLNEISSGGFRWGGLFVKLTSDEVGIVGGIVIAGLKRQQAADLAYINRRSTVP